jgi:MFS transporter, NNP family, nitrate/nitrite transporter
MENSKAKAFPLMPLLLLVGIFYLNFISRVILAPLLPIIEGDLGIGHGEAGSLFLYIAGGYSVGLLGCGFVSSRLSHRRTILLSTFTMGLAMLAISRSASIEGIHGGLVLIGFFAGLYLPCGIATITGLCTKEQWGKALSLHEMGPNLGFITAPLLSEVLLRFFSWRDGLAAVGFVQIFMGGLFFLVGKGGREKGAPPHLRAMHGIIKRPAFWIMVVLFITSIGASMGVYALMPLFMVSEIGLAREFANLLIGLSRAFGIVVFFAWGLISNRVSPQNALVIFLGANALLTLLMGAFPGPVTTTVLLLFQTAAVACLFVVNFTVLSLTFAADMRAIAVSLVIFIGMILGGGTLPSAIGYWAEAFSFSSGFILLGLFFLSALILFFRFRKDLDISPKSDG